MAVLTQEQLTARIAEKIKSDGVPSITTAEDVRALLTDVKDTLFANLLLKVTAVAGKVLSTNDYTNEDKDKVATIPEDLQASLSAIISNINTVNNALAAFSVDFSEMQNVIQSVAIDLNGKENIGVAAGLVTALKGGVSVEGDTLSKLYTLISSLTSSVTTLNTNVAGKENTGVAAGLVNALKDGVPNEGDTLFKLYFAIETIKAFIANTSNSNGIVDRVAEVLAIFNQYPEGVELLTILQDKENTGVAQSLIDGIIYHLHEHGDGNLYNAIENWFELRGVAQQYIDDKISLLQNNASGSLYDAIEAWFEEKGEAQNELRDNVPSEGDTLNKLYNLIADIKAIINGNQNGIVDTVAEILAVFNQYPEGIDLLNLLANKADLNALDAKADLVDGLIPVEQVPIIDRFLFNISKLNGTPGFSSTGISRNVASSTIWTNTSNGNITSPILGQLLNLGYSLNKIIVSVIFPNSSLNYTYSISFTATNINISFFSGGSLSNSAINGVIVEVRAYQ